MDARKLHENIKNTEDTLEVKSAQREDRTKRIAELQIQHSRSERNSIVSPL